MADLTMTALAMSLGELSARLIQSFLELLDSSLVTAITEKVLLFCVWDFVDAAVRLVETSYKVAAELLQSRSADGCSKESSQGRTELAERSARSSDGAESPTLAAPAATSFEEMSIDENPLTQRFDRLADGLWLFLDIYDRVRRFGEEEPYDSHAWGLRDFLKEVPEGRRLALLEDTFSLARRTEMSWDTKVTWCTALVASLTFVQQNVSSALELSSSMFLRYRKLMRLEQTFDVPTHLAFLERVPQWFDEMPVFMNSIGHSRPDRAELLFSRSSRLCTAENSSRLQTSRASSHASWMPERRKWADSTGYWAWHGHGAATLLEALGSGGRLGSSLSYTFWAVRSLDLPEPRCHTQTEVLYDPTACLQEQGWAGYVYMDSARADKTVARYEPRRWKGQRVHPTPFEIQSLRDGVVAPPEPMDVLVVSPLVGNCRDVVEMLRAESMTISKLVYVAINPMLPPPALAEPNFTAAFASYWRKSPEQLARGAVAAQCSLASTTEVLRPLSYSLLQVEHLYAVYVHSAFAEMAPDEMKEFEEWRLGWFCSPLSRYLMGLEASEASGAQGCAEAEAAKEALPTLRRFWARAEKAGGSHGTDCPVPYRGPWCQDADPSTQDEARPYRAAVHYVVNEDAEHLKELLFSIQSLWMHFNERFDYPVLIFHDGLSPKTRESIVAKTPGQRIWFFSVGNWVPSEAQHALHSNFGAGYMAQSRFRSGPVFHHEALDGFDYLWSLDSDSHFPAPVDVDPFLQLHSNPELVMGWSYITTTSPASVRRLWEYTMLYAMKEKVDIWSSTLSKNWKSGRTHFMSTFLSSSSVEGLDRMPLWNNRVLMTDCEVLRLSFFRSSRYQDYFRYLDSLEGFWSHRWGDHAVRTLGVGLALWEEDRPTWQQAVGRGSDGWPRAFQMDLPYAHQDFCQCDGECRPLHDPKRGVVFDALQGLRKKFWTCLPAPLDKDAEPRVRKELLASMKTAAEVEHGSVATRLPGTETSHVGKILSSPGL
ncbi:KTR4 [Symbiodinium sp. CCMP2456]|nr:KTR4 [Symbiodinium sp. CCMP2456]